MRPVAFLSDVEGRWDKLVDFCAGNPLVTLEGDVLRVADGARFVFGGDVCDRGPSSLRLVRCLLDARRAQPDRVVWLAGNRDINKLRLARELDGRPPAGAPSGVARPVLLRWILAETMGAGRAFEQRKLELGADASDDAVVDSFLAEIAPSGPLTSYLAAASLGVREGDTLFLHGGVTPENLGLIPGRAARERDVDAWLRGLDEFLASSVASYVAGRAAASGAPAWSDLIAYQAPVPGTRLNQASVVYARPTDDHGDPVLPAPEVIAALASAGIRRVVLGHTPSGDCPALLVDDDGFALVLADNSYAKIERGSRVIVDASAIHVDAFSTPDGAAATIARWSHAHGDVSPLGRRVAGERRLWKARLADGAYLGYRVVDGYHAEQVAVPAAEVAQRATVAPR